MVYLLGYAKSCSTLRVKKAGLPRSFSCRNWFPLRLQEVLLGTPTNGQPPGEYICTCAWREELAVRMLERAAKFPDYGSRLPIFQHHSHPVLLDSRLLVHLGFSYIWNVEYSICFSWTDYRLFNDFSQTCPAFCTSSSDITRFILNDIHKLFLTTS